MSYEWPQNPFKKTFLMTLDMLLTTSLSSSRLNELLGKKKLGMLSTSTPLFFLVVILNWKKILNENQLVVVDVAPCETISFVLVIELPRQDNTSSANTNEDSLFSVDEFVILMKSYQYILSDWVSGKISLIPTYDHYW